MGKSWLRSGRIHGRDIFLISAPLFAFLIVASDLWEFLDHDGARHPPLPYEHGGWAWQSREAFILNHILHIALPIGVVVLYLIPSQCWVLRPLGRFLAMAYNGAFLGVLLYSMTFGA